MECSQPHSLVVGDTLCTSTLKGTTSEVHDMFCEEWKRRWDHHKDLPPQHWDALLHWIDKVLPTREMTYAPITMSQWKGTIHAKKKFSATGMDGVSRTDLLSLPDNLQQTILDVVHHAELTGEWAPQLMKGCIHSLAKIPGAEEVGQFRPVTILPMIYRCWSTVRSREILRFLANIVPPTMYGNLPGKSSMNLWWELQAQLELCMYSTSRFHVQES